MKILKTKHLLGPPQQVGAHDALETYDLRPPVSGAQMLTASHLEDGRGEYVVVLWRVD